MEKFITERYGRANKLAIYAWNELRESVYSEPIEVHTAPFKANIDIRKVRPNIKEKRFSSDVFKRPHLVGKLDVILIDELVHIIPS